MCEHMAGQIAVKAALAILAGSCDQLQGQAVGTDELLRSLSMGLAIMIASDSRNTTPNRSVKMLRSGAR